jgi:TrmH family RNA methyltransferase
MTAREDGRSKIDVSRIVSFSVGHGPPSSIFDLRSLVSVLDNVVLVLNEPQDPINIAATIRVMKNMGFARLRLVNPVQYDPWRIEGIAHGTRDLVDTIEHFDSLAGALAYCVKVAAFAGKRRAVRLAVATPREMAAQLLETAAEGRVALLFGQEDHGLPNEALDLAQLLVHIPTTEHSSLNLAQAVMVALYELHIAAGDATRVLAPPKKEAPPAEQAEWEQTYVDLEKALAEIRFFRTRNQDNVMRSVRSLLARAEPDGRELMLVRAMGIEVLRTIDRIRKGLPD